MSKPLEKFRYLLLQIRDQDDPMRQQEVECFASELRCPVSNIAAHDLISGVPVQSAIDAVDFILVGGSGAYSVVSGGPWLDAALQTMRDLYEQAKPTFASCWGFQAFAAALGGRVVTDPHRAEIGTLEIRTSTAANRDPVFGPLAPGFLAQMGHQDIVDQLPHGSTLLASSDQVENEAFVFDDKPIYATQFHPELSKESLMGRLKAYPSYVQQITGMALEDFMAHIRPTYECSELLRNFVQHFG